MQHVSIALNDWRTFLRDKPPGCRVWVVNGDGETVIEIERITKISSSMSGTYRQEINMYTTSPRHYPVFSIAGKEVELLRQTFLAHRDTSMPHVRTEHTFHSFRYDSK